MVRDDHSGRDGGDAETASYGLSGRDGGDAETAGLATPKSDPTVFPAGMNIALEGHRELNPDVSRICYPVMVAKKIPKSQWK